MKYNLTPHDPGGELLSEMLINAGAAVDFPCSGNHRCGKCKVKASGELSAMSSAEAAMLTSEEISDGIRLACFTKAFSTALISAEDQADGQIMEDGAAHIETKDPMISKGSYGAAVDIGTTTLVCRLYTSSGKALGSKSEINRQRAFGADVISRINYGIKNGNEILHKTIVEQIEAMLQSLAAESGIKRSQIDSSVVTGNTTMLHFFSGLDPRGIGFLPFKPESLFGCTMDNILGGVSVYLPPCVSAYVGADITCGILASEMYTKDDSVLLIDIGTNGEMALCSGGIIYCCSTAAGPAFEGAGISCGMTASPGAIAHTYYDNDKKTPVYKTIGDAPVKGICGSGIVDAAAMLLEEGALLPSGRISKEDTALAPYINDAETAFSFTPEVSVTQEDVRQIQLAKGAISAGALTLCMTRGIDIQKIDLLHLCGGFGAYVSRDSAEKIGLIPKGSALHTKVLGNSAISGASMLLLNASKREALSAILNRCQYVELSGNELFMDNYINAMSFGDITDRE